MWDIPADLEMGMSTTDQPWGCLNSSSNITSKPSRNSSSHPRAPVEVVSSAQVNFLRHFKRFDTVEDFSDHHYVSKGNASKQHSKTWVKKVQVDWKIFLENNLPETISVRACESRMYLMRAVIIGAEGTPYHDGLFFFDIHFPDNYPSVPPMVHYHSGGLRINPNLYSSGKVCLSLLGTWNGNPREQWLPQESTMLQLLVSIQALILNQKPYFNEPAYERTKGTPSGEAYSKVYSENVYISSLRTMVYGMRKPPKHFEEFVRSHYFERAHDILKAANGYIDGAPVCSIVKGTSQVESMKFRTEVAVFMKTVVDEFVKLGVNELEDIPEQPPAGIPEVIDKKNKGKSILNYQPWWFPNFSSKRTSARANFKRFDSVQHFSDHHYVSKGNASKQHSRYWANKIQADWKILEKDLPETIFVRACESRMDLMRAVIIGAEGTPYHDGLFFLDIHFPDTYPSVAPMVHYHSGGLTINPNLYNSGHVCLSLLGTWYGNTRENWLPQESTMLLVSIQGLILNRKPYYNEPFVGWTKWTPLGEPFSKDGAPVGSIVKGTSQGGSMKFRTEVAVFMKTVVDEFVVFYI
ncbi:hypothetical protein HID58_070583 [Brassica napus]|uniref:UBC core domain-containing protein n=1 Tax=Brassica napus TaxID=3708 RepID=A0ABQ7YZ65_BRANA|nr:hypothetical protein HID58_070583 [Brassica napus]